VPLELHVLGNRRAVGTRGLFKHAATTVDANPQRTATDNVSAGC